MPPPSIVSFEEIDSMNQLAWEMRASEIDEPIALSHNAFEASKLVSYKKGLGYSQRNLGYLYSRLCEFDTAQQYLHNSSEIAGEISDRTLLSSTFNNIGLMYISQGKYAGALEYFQRNLEITDETQDSIAKALTLNNIGDVYFALGDFPEMLRHYFSAMKIYEPLQDGSGKAVIYNNIGNTYKLLHEYDKAYENYVRSLELHQRYKNLIGEAVAQINIAVLHLYLNEFAQAHKRFLEALAIQQLLDNNHQKARIYIGLGMAAIGIARYQEALRHLNNGLQLAKKIDAREQQAEALLEIGKCYYLLQDDTAAAHYLEEVHTFPDQNLEVYQAHKILSDIYAKQGNFEKAWHCHTLYHDGYQNHSNKKAEERLKQLYMSLEVENALHERELYRSRSEELADALMELKAVHADLKKVSEVRNEILGIVAHDLKNPLSGIILWAEVLEQQLPDNDPRLKNVENILKLAGHMSAIIRELLDTGANVVDVSMQNIVILDAVAVALEVFEASQKIASIKNITIHHSLPEALGIKADSISFRRVMENLLSNAIKFSPQFTSVFLRMCKEGDNIRLTIEDQGPGISAEDQKKLFHKFGRLSARPTGGEHSTGLGLYIVKLLVIKMNGKIYCESELGKGTRFIVELPLNGL